MKFYLVENKYGLESAAWCFLDIEVDSTSSPPDFRPQPHVVRNQTHEGQWPNHAEDDDVDFLVGPANQVSHPIEKVHASHKNVIDLFCIHVCQVFSLRSSTDHG